MNKRRLLKKGRWKRRDDGVEEERKRKIGWAMMCERIANESKTQKRRMPLVKVILKSVLTPYHNFLLVYLGKKNETDPLYPLNRRTSGFQDNFYSLFLRWFILLKTHTYSKNFIYQK